MYASRDDERRASTITISLGSTLTWNSLNTPFSPSHMLPEFECHKASPSTSSASKTPFTSGQSLPPARNQHSGGEGIKLTNMLDIDVPVYLMSISYSPQSSHCVGLQRSGYASVLIDDQSQNRLWVEITCESLLNILTRDRRITITCYLNAA
jgi:hypothetical protein